MVGKDIFLKIKLWTQPADLRVSIYRVYILECAFIVSYPI